MLCYEKEESDCHRKLIRKICEKELLKLIQGGITFKIRIIYEFAFMIKLYKEQLFLYQTRFFTVCTLTKQQVEVKNNRYTKNRHIIKDDILIYSIGKTLNKGFL